MTHEAQCAIVSALLQHYSKDLLVTLKIIILGLSYLCCFNGIVVVVSTFSVAEHSEHGGATDTQC